MSTQKDRIDDIAVEEDVPPNPSALIESMRAFGYSLPTAVADLVDNSISAGASAIAVQLGWNGPGSYLSVLDDGAGMDEDGLRNAMRLGSRSPVERRAKGDLGRFGLGLKSAAFSQGRSLTVATRAAGSDSDHSVAVRRWDLDHVEQTGAWSLLTRAAETSVGLVDAALADRCGTYVLVERLDRLVGAAAIDDDDAHKRFQESIGRVESHLRMVFHRFLEGRGAVELWVNGIALEPWDPFMERHDATQVLPSEALPLGTRRVEVQPFVLPHFSKLSGEQHAAASGPKGWNAQQGFYVYRSKRLLVAGEWLGLPRMQQEEHYKLARIRIDLDNAMDEAWQIDVRKATARPPGALRDQLRRIAEATRRRAADAYRFRGKTQARTKGASSLQFAWNRVRTRDGVTYRLNRGHPIIERALEDLGDKRAHGERLLRMAEENLPVAGIVIDAHDQPAMADGAAPYRGAQSEVESMLREALAVLTERGVPSRTALDALAGTEPFNFHPELVGVLREELAG